jgi:PAS domain S-box-containing protein
MSPPARDTIAVFEHGQLLDAVLDAAASLIVVVDAEGRLLRWNRACEELLGYRQAELEAPFALLDLVPAAERPAAEAAMRALLSGESPVH